MSWGFGVCFGYLLVAFIRLREKKNLSCDEGTKAHISLHPSADFRGNTPIFPQARVDTGSVFASFIL